MRDDYLWNRSGAPDPEVQRLERILAGFRSQRPTPELEPRPRPRWRAAAAAALVVGGAWFAMRSGGAPEGWQVARAGAAPGRLAVGQTLETGAVDHATLHLGSVGVVEVEGNSRLRLEHARSSQQRMALERGIIRALIWAPPRTFVVDTPSAVATDLGCYYTLEVDPDGGGLVGVLAGWVSFAESGRESFIPAGAACLMRPGQGPGTPYRQQASPAFRRALQDFDFSGGAEGSLETVLAEATKPDAFTLWHLLTRAAPVQIPRIYEALSALVPPPAGVTREGILVGDRRMLNLWWNQLGLGDTAWWRHVERRFP